MFPRGTLPSLARVTAVAPASSHLLHNSLQDNGIVYRSCVQPFECAMPALCDLSSQVWHHTHTPSFAPTKLSHVITAPCTKVLEWPSEEATMLPLEQEDDVQPGSCTCPPPTPAMLLPGTHFVVAQSDRFPSARSLLDAVRSALLDVCPRNEIIQDSESHWKVCVRMHNALDVRDISEVECVARVYQKPASHDDEEYNAYGWIVELQRLSTTNQGHEGMYFHQQYAHIRRCILEELSIPFFTQSRDILPIPSIPQSRDDAQHCVQNSALAHTLDVLLSMAQSSSMEPRQSGLLGLSSIVAQFRRCGLCCEKIEMALPLLMEDQHRFTQSDVRSGAACEKHPVLRLAHRFHSLWTGAVTAQ